MVSSIPFYVNSIRYSLHIAQGTVPCSIFLPNAEYPSLVYVAIYNPGVPHTILDDISCCIFSSILLYYIVLCILFGKVLFLPNVPIPIALVYVTNYNPTYL